VEHVSSKDGKVNYTIINTKVVWRCESSGCGEKLSEYIPSRGTIFGKTCFQCGIKYEIKNRGGDLFFTVVNKSLSIEEKAQLESERLKSVSPSTPALRDIQGPSDCLDLFKEAQSKLSSNIQEVERHPDKLTFYEHPFVDHLLESPYYSKLDFYEADSKRICYVSRGRVVYTSNTLVILPWTSPFASLMFTVSPGQYKPFPFPQGHPSLPKINKNILLNERESYNIENKNILKMEHIDSKHKFSTDGVEVYDLMGTIDIELSDKTDVDSKKIELEKAKSSAVFDTKTHYTLTEIVALIRKEQDDIIRAPAEGCLLIKGAAGSGKTTIAIHRIIYLLDNFKEFFDEKKIIICVFNVALVTYLKHLLNDLGIRHVSVIHKDSWTRELADSCIKDFQLQFQSNVGRLEKIVKTRVFHINTIQNFLVRLSDDNKKSIFSEIDTFGFDLPRSKRIKNIVNDYRLLKIPDIKILEKKICDVIELSKESIITRLLRDDEKDKLAKNKIKNRLNAITKELKQYRKHLLAYYESDEFKTAAFKNTDVGAEALEGFVKKQGEIFKSNKLLLNDLHLILLIIYFLNDGFPVDNQSTKLAYDHIVVDEVQDMPAPFLFLLSKLNNPQTNSMTIAGDITQQVYPEAGLRSWSECGLEIKHESELKLSHRSTYHNMMFANAILGKKAYEIDSLTPADKVSKLGERPVVRGFSTYAEEMEFVKKQIQLIKAQDKNSSIVITRIGGKLYEIERMLISCDIDCYVAYQGNFEFSNRAAITTPYQIKGLEYDYVFIVSLENLFNHKELKNKEHVFYMNVTRAQKRSFITYSGVEPEVIKKIPRAYYD